MSTLKDLVKDLEQASKEFKKFRRNLPEIAGTEMQRVFRRNMDKEGFIQNGKIEKWPTRKPGAPRNARRKLLRDRGTLYSSIRITAKTTDSVAVGVDLDKVPYAQIHNEGGKLTGTVTVKKHSRKIVRTVKVKSTSISTKRTTSRRQKALYGTGQVKQHSRKMNTPIPKRQYMGFTPDLDKTVEREIYSRLDSIFN